MSSRSGWTIASCRPADARSLSDESCGAPASGVRSEAGGRSRASAAVEADVRAGWARLTAHARSRAVCATAARRRLRPTPPAASMRRGGTCTRGTFVTSRSRSPPMEAERSHRRCASATTTGCSTAAPKMDRRWPSTPMHAFTSSGRRLCRARQRRANRRLALFYAMSQDGRRFTPRAADTDEGRPSPSAGRASARNGELIVAWDEQANGTRRIALARGTIDAKGTARFMRQPIGDLTRAEYPTLATTSDGTIVAWTSGTPGQTVIRAERLAN